MVVGKNVSPNPVSYLVSKPGGWCRCTKEGAGFTAVLPTDGSAGFTPVASKDTSTGGFSMRERVKAEHKDAAVVVSNVAKSNTTSEPGFGNMTAPLVADGSPCHKREGSGGVPAGFAGISGMVPACDTGPDGNFSSLTRQNVAPVVRMAAPAPAKFSLLPSIPGSRQTSEMLPTPAEGEAAKKDVKSFEIAALIAKSKAVSEKVAADNVAAEKVRAAENAGGGKTASLVSLSNPVKEARSDGERVGEAVGQALSGFMISPTQLSGANTGQQEEAHASRRSVFGGQGHEIEHDNRGNKGDVNHRIGLLSSDEDPGDGGASKAPHMSEVVELGSNELTHT